MAVPEPLETALVQGILAADRDGTLRLIATLRGNVSSIVAASLDSNSDDEHDPEGATIAFERSQAGALLESAQRHLTEVDAALQRLADNRYGRCETCGEQIAPGRLQARPTARTCISCAQVRNPTRRRG